MGKVRTLAIKRLARKLVEEHRDLFTENFEANKKVISSIVSYRSKKLRNQLAGYVTNLIRLYTKKQKILEENTGVST